MSPVGQPERQTQHRIVKLFTEELGYTYLGHWQDRVGNSNIEEGLLRAWLQRHGHPDKVITKVIHAVKSEANMGADNLYTANRRVYERLRYGVPVKAEIGVNTEHIPVIDWVHPENNHFGIAEEVTLHGQREKRPDIVLYVNGIALGVLELKRSSVSMEEGIRQNITNQQERFIQPFFTTVQFVMAGNDTQGLRYGTTGTEEKYFLAWKEDENDNSRYQVDKYLLRLCNKSRFLELIHDFVLFDGGEKKLPRPHQYFGIKQAREHVARKEGGIIWHTQGSGKSIVMVLLARWILENHPQARVAVITDRDELDKQIRDVFEDAGEEIYRTRSGRDLMAQLGQATPRLLCSLIHKFGKKEVENFEQFIKELESQPAVAVGEIYVFVDECHRTQSGRLHRTMKAMLPHAVFIGFTGTPLLKKDKATSLEVFGRYIHTYKFNEAVSDGIVKDLMYEARDIDQRLSSPERIDQWFDAKTRGLNDFQTNLLKKQWATLQKVLSSRSRMDRIVGDIILDFGTKPRLDSKRGNAILVASSIYEACRYYELFQHTSLKGYCAVVTSYNPSTRDIVTEDTGANTETQKEYIYHRYEELLKDVQPQPGKTRAETYEDNVKRLFKKEPATLRLLIVVDKLLTGFDAPSCTYIYLDKSMQDHGLFQAICRVNRLDGEDKLYGYIIDYKDLFDSVKGAISVYTSELDYDDFSREDCQVLMQDRLQKGRERLDEAMEQLALLCEPVLPPKDALDYQRYFCGNTERPDDLERTAPLRHNLYKAIVAFIRAYANIADEMEAAGYTPAQCIAIQKDLDFYLKLREEIKRASNEVFDSKAYEADMRYLIDHYIQADESRKVSEFDDTPLLEIIERLGIEEAIRQLPERIRQNPEAVAETIERNVRAKIIREHLIDPAFFDRMSRLLDQVILERKQKALDYASHLERMAQLIRQMNRQAGDGLPKTLDTPAKRALYHNLDENEELALAMDKAVRYHKKADWKGDDTKELELKQVIFYILEPTCSSQEEAEQETERIFPVIREQEEYQ